MAKVDRYRETLKALNDWTPFLLQESGLPGRRGNLELAYAVAEEGDRARFEHFLSLASDPVKAPSNSPEEFLAFCGVLGLGKLLARGDRQALDKLRSFASDPRWRTREAVAQALQYLGDVDMEALLHDMNAWSQGSPLEQRAAAAALCEPRLRSWTASPLRCTVPTTAAARSSRS
jgi:HEAT repeat protein